MQEYSESFNHQNPEAESDEASRFDKSLHELRDLRSQLHYAASYCEKTFLNAKDKKTVVESTKEYICRALVTVVDHLGSVSNNLDCELSKSDVVSQTELGIDCLNQRLVTCQQYAHKLAIAEVSWWGRVPRHHPRYISPQIPDLQNPNETSRKYDSPIAVETVNKHGFEWKEEAPLFLYTYNHKPCLARNPTRNRGGNSTGPCPTSVLPVRDGLPMLQKVQKPSFQFEGMHKHKRSLLNWKTVQNNDILWLLRRNKRTT